MDASLRAEELAVPAAMNVGLVVICLIDMTAPSTMNAPVVM